MDEINKINRSYASRSPTQRLNGSKLQIAQQTVHQLFSCCYSQQYIYFLMNSQQIDTCFNQLKAYRKLSIIQSLIDNHYPIKEPYVQPLPKIQNKDPYIRQASFAPSPELLKSYQQTFSKANQDHRITNTKNYKLQANFSSRTPQRNQVKNKKDAAKIMDHCVIIEEREAIILDQLKSGNIEATIPQMDQTLFTNELSHLQQKEVVIQNTLSINEWKKLRNRFAS